MRGSRYMRCRSWRYSWSRKPGGEDGRAVPLTRHQPADILPPKQASSTLCIPSRRVVDEAARKYHQGDLVKSNVTKPTRPSHLEPTR